MTTWAIYAFAALAEVLGCFAFWAWLKLGKSALWTLPGTLALILFALALTRVPTAASGRAFAAYGGVYIVASLIWMWSVDGARPTRFDLLGGAFCLAGVGIILMGTRVSP